MAEKFHFLKYGLAFVLSFIGVKMLLPLAAEGSIMILGDENSSAFASILRRFVGHEFDHTLINISLGIVVGAILIAVILSLIFPPKGAAVATEYE